MKFLPLILGLCLESLILLAILNHSKHQCTALNFATAIRTKFYSFCPVHVPTANFTFNISKLMKDNQRLYLQMTSNPICLRKQCGCATMKWKENATEIKNEIVEYDIQGNETAKTVMTYKSVGDTSFRKVLISTEIGGNIIRTNDGVHVFYTDYASYLIVWQCDKNFNLIFSFLATHKAELSQALTNRLKSLFPQINWQRSFSQWKISNKYCSNVLEDQKQNKIEVPIISNASSELITSTPISLYTPPNTSNVSTISKMPITITTSVPIFFNFEMSTTPKTATPVTMPPLTSNLSEITELQTELTTILPRMVNFEVTSTPKPTTQSNVIPLWPTIETTPKTALTFKPTEPQSNSFPTFKTNTITSLNNQSSSNLTNTVSTTKKPTTARPYNSSRPILSLAYPHTEIISTTTKLPEINTSNNSLTWNHHPDLTNIVSTTKKTTAATPYTSSKPILSSPAYPHTEIISTTTKMPEVNISNSSLTRNRHLDLYNYPFMAKPITPTNSQPRLYHSPSLMTTQFCLLFTVPLLSLLFDDFLN